MAVGEDCTTVMEQFLQDSSNLGPEIQHIFEEIEAKEQRIAECRRTIEKLDGGLQKYTRLNGSLSAHPKEENFIKTIREHFLEMEKLQDEKIVLAERNEKLLDRHVRRLDMKIRDLQADGNMPADPTLPSLLNSSNANRPSMSSTPVTGSSTPLNPISHNAAGPASTIIASSGLSRLVQPQVQPSTNIFAAPAQPHHPALTLAPHHANSAPATPAPTSLLHQRHRESSAGANDVKRRRLQPHLGSVPPTSSGLARQSSVGPGTPKPGTPGASGVAGRAGSAGPRSGIKKTAFKKVAPHQQRKAPGTGPGPKKAGRRKKKSLLGPSNKATPSSDGEDNDSTLTSASGSDSEMVGTPQAGGEGHEHEHDGDEQDEEEDEGDDGGDDRKYCTCRTVSFGNMVACDNDNCPYEWFHWSCVGLTKEPPGKWFCEECRTRLAKGV